MDLKQKFNVIIKHKEHPYVFSLKDYMEKNKLSLEDLFSEINKKNANANSLNEDIVSQNINSIILDLENPLKYEKLDNLLDKKVEVKLLKNKNIGEKYNEKIMLNNINFWNFSYKAFFGFWVILNGYFLIKDMIWELKYILLFILVNIPICTLIFMKNKTFNKKKEKIKHNSDARLQEIEMKMLFLNKERDYLEKSGDYYNPYVYFYFIAHKKIYKKFDNVVNEELMINILKNFSFKEFKLNFDEIDKMFCMSDEEKEALKQNKLKEKYGETFSLNTNYEKVFLPSALYKNANEEILNSIVENFRKKENEKWKKALIEKFEKNIKE